MSKIIRIGMFIVTLSFLISNLAVADDQDRKRDRKKDGTCQTGLVSSDEAKVLAADQDRKRDRKKDGTCRTGLVSSDEAKVLAADQDRKRDRKKDGTCHMGLRT
jgi:hypothetical protein